MASQNNLTAVFTDIANAIRDKKGSVNTIKPVNMADEISSIISKSYIKYYGIDQKCYFETDITTIPESKFAMQYAWNGSTNYLTDVYFPNATTKTGYVFYGQKYLANVYFPLLEGLGGLYFGNCSSLVNVELPKVYKIDNQAFDGCSSLEKVDIGRTDEHTSDGKVSASTFNNCSLLKSVIIRNNQVLSLLNSNAFSGTPIATSNTEGYIYVPLSLVENYRNATNWTTYKSKIMPIDLLEGNYVEVDLGTLNWFMVETGGFKTFYTSGVRSGNDYYMMCSKYLYADDSTTRENLQIRNDAWLGANLVYIIDNNYTDPTAFKNAMSGVILRYLPKE